MYTNDSIYGQKGPLKRALMEAAPIQEGRSSKRSKPEPMSIISSEQIPDDGTKPGHSYAMLIGMAILRAPNRRLTLAQIYKWISDTYSFYNASEPGWQNSIRHNLSLNKAFVKQERPKDDPGKGNYWAIEVDMEGQFSKEKQVRRAGAFSDDLPALPAATGRKDNLPSSSAMMPPAPSHDLPSNSAHLKSEQTAMTGPDISSDATIPASDAFAPEEPEDSYLPPPDSTAVESSPPQQLMHSSPPIVRHTQIREGTPPPVPRFPVSSVINSHKRKFASMDDSGYFSNLDSSALRPHQGGRLLTSEADRPRIKRGRAEEEIARLRGSSYDSPTKSRTYMPQTASHGLISSPIRRQTFMQGASQMLPPLTPAVKFKVPAKPPPSVSPNTNLRMHRDRVRELVGSPIRGGNSLEESLPWSPAFNLDVDGPYMFNDFNTEFDIFADTNIDISCASNGSPEKRSSKRSRVERPHSVNILSDITNHGSTKTITSTPKLNFMPNLQPPVQKPAGRGSVDNAHIQSPTLMPGVFDLPQEELYGNEFLAEDMSDFSGMDIMQGFQKIGAGGQKLKVQAKGSMLRPGMGRSFTSRF